MFIINCPFCGEREQSEFKAGGEAHIERPKQPTELSVFEMTPRQGKSSSDILYSTSAGWARSATDFLREIESRLA